MIPYQPFADHLRSIGVLASPSELHAQASAVLCVNQAHPFEVWFTQMVNEYSVGDAGNNDFKTVMSAVYDYAKEQLAKDDFSYKLLLPQDQSSLSERIQVLSEWVATFVSALGIAGMSTAALSQEGQEFLQDLSQIARIDAEAEDVTGEELDFIEITEYVRTGVMVLFAELNASTMPSKSIN